MSAILKPCPYCGSDAELITKHKALAYFIECANAMCNALMQADTAEEVIAMWNARSEENTLRAEIDQLKSEFLKLTQLFEDVVNQACHSADGLEDYSISAFENALDYLTEKGRITEELYPKWIAKTEESK